MKACIIAIAKDEERYLDEWIKYHLSLGFTNFVIYDNNDIGNDGQRDLLSKYPCIEWIDVRGRDALNKAGMQRGCYTTAFNRIAPFYDYISLLDIDEFVYLNGLSLESFVHQPKFADTDVIHLNWRYYGDNDLVLYDPRPVQVRFTEPCPDDVRYAQPYPENRWVKSIIKVGKPLSVMLNHSVVLDNGVCRRANGDLGDMSSMWEDIDFSAGYIKHYGTKTIDEYVQRKCLNIHQIFDNTTFSATQRLNWFFNVNRHTPQKDLIANWFYSRGL